MMIKISYYKTSKDKIPKAFCMLAEKCYHSNISLFVFTNNEKSTTELDKALWTYSKKQFIPHGTIHDPICEKQPILLGEVFRNSNKAASMIIINADKDKVLDFLASTQSVMAMPRRGRGHPQDEEIEDKKVLDGDVATAPRHDGLGSYERLFFIYDEDEILPAVDLENILSKSAMGEFKFESYVQEINGGWRKEG